VKLGATDAPSAPLDPQLRVKGVTGLRVADGSAVPFLTTVTVDHHDDDRREVCRPAQDRLRRGA